MKRTILAGVILAAVFLAAGINISLAKEKNLRERKIVVFYEGVSEGEKEQTIAQAGGEKIKKIDLINAQVMKIDQAEENRLKNDPAVKRIDKDVIVEMSVRPEKTFKVKPTPVPSPAETIDWGVLETEADKVWSTNTGAGVKVGVVDTGISSTHPDLKVAGGMNAINPRKSWNDDNGHGSHVAGIIAGLDNEIGIIGVAPKADLYAIKVLNSAGSGYLSDIIEGLEWAIVKNLDVVNLSLGSSSDVISFKEAIKKTKASGIVVVVAAGNTGGAVSYPAAYPESIAVSATDKDNLIAYFSSRGEEIDLAAPGVEIYSTYKGTDYKILSGTSMAAPHVTGVAALVLSKPAVCDTNNDGICSPDEVQKRLEETAIDLETTGWDILYGHGLVNALRTLTL